MKRVIAILLALFLMAMPVSAQMLNAFDFENQDIEAMTASGDLTANGMIEFKLSDSSNGQALNIHLLPSEEEIGKKIVKMNVPIYCRDMSLKSGVCLEVSIPEYEERPRYIEFIFQLDMPGRAQTVSGQPIFYTDANGVTTEGQVQAGNAVRLNSGFEGKVFIPFAAFQSTAGDTITSARLDRMYMVFDCDLFKDYSFAIDNIAFYTADDLPEAVEELPPDFTMTGSKDSQGSTIISGEPEAIPGTETITHKTEPDYKVITRIFYVLEWFDWLLIALGVAVGIGLIVWLIIFLKKRKKKKQANAQKEI